MTSKIFHFISPSNQHIVIDDKYTYCDIVTIEDLKYLFILKNRLYTTDMFEIALNNNILELTTKLVDLPSNKFDIIHIYKSNHVEEEIKSFDDCKVETQEVEVKSSSSRCIIM